ncbi:MAG: 16S rRNA (cytosine(1402)-N(4))-methyltransferase RsmH [Helicobacteraceae bacterium]|jgi:16S rRNA (cytosine1402-N4)-methyltransferase|nr:16S rRNA (cytosine(1402)-N(4))-methyltransferase RsmH [Helicobacteraceae bacterium]
MQRENGEVSRLRIGAANERQSPHTPVLTNEVFGLFGDLKDGVLVDCTLGYGGHAFEALSRYPKIAYIGIDRDQTALDYSAKRLKIFGDRFRAIRAEFADEIATIKEPIAGVLADLGVSSLQLDDGDRGFGFNSDCLDMRMDQSSRFSAIDVINGYEESELSRLFFEYGEEPRAKAIASLIIKKRPFYSAKALSGLIAANFSRGKIHSATRVFQAIRIEVNGELDQLGKLLDSLENIKPSGAVIAVISFHSLEDRMVKDRFKKWARECVCPPNALRCECGGNRRFGEVLTKKPITAKADELRSNPRSRSAKLRGFRFIANQNVR